MKSKFIIISILSVSFIILAGMTYKDRFQLYQEKEYEIRDFEGVRLGGTFRVEIKYGKEYGVIAKGLKKDLENLELEVVNGILIAGCKSNNSDSKATILKISMPVLKSADLYGATSSVISGFNEKSNNLILRLSDSSRVVTDSDCNFLDLQVKDASVLVFKEHVNSINASIKRSSRLLGRGGVCEYSYHRVGWI